MAGRQIFSEDKTMKLCTLCKSMLSIDNFAVVAGTKSLRAGCNLCLKLIQRELRQEKRDEINERRRSKRINDREWREERNKIRREKYRANPEPVILQGRDYYARTKDLPEKKAKNREYQNNRLIIDPIYKLKKNFRTRIHSAIKHFGLTGATKKNSTFKYVGCTVQDAKSHLESKFQPGMSWENYGRGGWEIDHIIPLAAFDLGDESQWYKAFHYSNIQPLWAFENRSKGASHEG